MKELLKILNSKWTRIAFMVAAVAAGVWAVASKWDEFSAAISSISLWVPFVALLLSLAYVFVTMLSWRTLLNGSGPSVEFAPASQVFFPSQVAKYLPGGIWNFVAAAEIGVEYKVSRRRSVTVMITSMVVSILSGALFAALALLLGPDGLRTDYWWVTLVIVVLIVVLYPPVLNRAVSLALRLLRREPLENYFSFKTVFGAVAWASVAWILAGLQVWLFMVSLGLEAPFLSIVEATGAYALAWTVGFLVFFVPAGIGIREGVLTASLGTLISPGAIIAVVLLSRVFLTVADIALGIVFAVSARANTPSSLPISSDRPKDVL